VLSPGCRELSLPLAAEALLREVGLYERRASLGAHIFPPACDRVSHRRAR